eukprot:675919-Prymnesium_polylepis.1
MQRGARRGVTWRCSESGRRALRRARRRRSARPPGWKSMASCPRSRTTAPVKDQSDIPGCYQPSPDMSISGTYH